MRTSKSLSPTAEDYDLDALEFHIRFGPYVVRTDGVTFSVVPIRPQYHQRLFPEVEQQTEIFSGQTPFGNSIRKAYLCKSSARYLSPGDVLLFYRSRDRRSVQCTAVIEGTRGHRLTYRRKPRRPEQRLLWELA